MDLIAIYVEDHLALSLAGIRLARRCRGENPEGELGAFLDGFIQEIEEDRAVLREVAYALGTRGSLVKELAAAAGELAGRLKPNGRWVRYSDLSRVWELEALVAGSESRRGMWRLLGKAARHDRRLAGFAFEPLEERAMAHKEALDRLRLRAAELAFRTRAPRARLVPAPSER